MRLEIENQLGDTKRCKKPVVKLWTKNPGDLSSAICAAGHYAKRDGVRMVVVPGNSYGRAVYHISAEAGDIRKFIPNLRADKFVSLAVVEPDGSVYKAKAWAK